MVLIACFEIKSIKFCYLSHFSCIADGASSDNVHDQKMILFGQSTGQCQAVNLPGIGPAHARVATVPGGQPAGHWTGSRLSGRSARRSTCGALH